MNELEALKFETDKQVLNALYALRDYAKGYGGPAIDHKGCTPNRKAIEVLVAAFPSGEPEDDEGSMRWFDALIQCYDYPGEAMLADACQEEIERLERKMNSKGS